MTEQASVTEKASPHPRKRFNTAGPCEGDRHYMLPPLARLPEAQQRAIALTKLEGLSCQEAAEQLGASESAIKVQVHRGLKKLAEWVGK